MVKDKIITLDENVDYYVLEEIEYNSKKYILVAECDVEKDFINEEELGIKELKFNKDNELEVVGIDDKELATQVTAMLIEKVRESQQEYNVDE